MINTKYEILNSKSRCSLRSIGIPTLHDLYILMSSGQILNSKFEMFEPSPSGRGGSVKRQWVRAIAAVFCLLLTVGLFGCSANKKNKAETAVVTRGDILASIPASGSVTPYNRLEIKPPVPGRIESILVQEGNHVKKGEVLAWLSSTERAALIDAARSKGAAELKYWEDVYKPAPMIAPIDGFIILRNMEPGQTVTVAEAPLVMADKLIVKAMVDETDLSRVELGQKVTIVLDAYPDKTIDGSVEHIKYESQIINNVTVYEVDVVADQVPEFFRSGQSATVNFQQESRKNVLILPTKAIRKSDSQNYVFVKQDGKVQALKVNLGAESGDQVELVSGVDEGTQVLIPDAKMVADVLARPRPGGLGGIFRRGR